MLYFGRFALGSPAGGTIGTGPDVQIFVWGLRWWPYALSHGLNPFVSHVVWQPYGSDILWSTTVPGLSLLAAPVTLTLGPVVAWNVLCVLAPALSAWAAYLFCLELTDKRGPAIVGGLLFGFSSYQLSEGQAHLQLTMSLCVPLAGWLVMRQLRGALTPKRFAVRMSALLVAQFLISPEILVTMLFVGALALAAAVVLVPTARAALRGLVQGALTGIAGAGVMLAPLLVVMLRFSPARLNASIGYSADLLNLFVPTRVTALGGAWAPSLVAAFPGNLSEQTAYIGLPVGLILIAFAAAHRREPRVRRLLFALTASVLLSLGPRLTVGGHAVLWLPGALVAHVPLLKDAQPARFALYTALTTACIVAVWLSDIRRYRPAAWLLAGLAVLSLAPATGATRWWRTTPHGITSGALARLIPAGSNVISLPFWNLTDRGLLAQSSDDMRFNLSDVWLQAMPNRYQHAFDTPKVLSAPELAAVRGPVRIDAFEDTMCSMRIGYALVWRYGTRMLAGLDLRPWRTGGADLYRLPPCRPNPIARARAHPVDRDLLRQA
jgi:hypothetical protein